jgi:uncharacterized membrane protein
MSKTRLEAFSDAVIAIVITIMVLHLDAPQGTSWSDLTPQIPIFLSYVLSFAYLGIYWNSHHHMLHASERINGKVLWANLHLLFWLSLIPFATDWMDDNHAAKPPTAFYGSVLLMAAVAYQILQTTLVNLCGANSKLREAVGRDLKGKASIGLYLIALVSVFIEPWISVGIYVFVALLWLVPDPRIERNIDAH